MLARTETPSLKQIACHHIYGYGLLAHRGQMWSVTGRDGVRRRGLGKKNKKKGEGTAAQVTFEQFYPILHTLVRPNPTTQMLIFTL